MSIKVLVVDDSLFMRTLISDILRSDPEVEVVDTAKSGNEALQKIAKRKLDVITLDINMPEMDGLTTLKNIMERSPLPVVMLSAYSDKEADITIKCLNAGAVGAVLKPSGELSLDIETIKEKLLQEVKAAALAKVGRVALKLDSVPSTGTAAADKVILIGASTGGPQAVTALLSVLPANFSVPVIVIQHMPSKFFVKSFASSLEDNCQIPVIMLRSGENLKTNRIYVAPVGDMASIDKTMQSMIKRYKSNVLGIVLTGMGRDGVKGMQAIKESGGSTIVQDDSATINGMPEAVIEAGYADRVLSLDKIVRALMEFAEK